MASNLNVSNELAASIRRVNARYVAAGSPACPTLRRLWFALDADIDRAEAAGDDPAARRAIAAWQQVAIAAIDESV